MTHKPVHRSCFLFTLLILLTPQKLTTQQPAIQTPYFPDETTELLYNNLRIPGLQYQAFYHAINGYRLLKQQGFIQNDGIITVIDYSLPSTVERVFLIDIKNQILIQKSLVAHGKNTGENYALHFSNKPGSHQSSLGFFVTGNTYYGQNGYSLVLNGLDTTYNEYAKSRAIVVHGADYVSHIYIEKNGRLGRSFGCPALPLESCHEIIDLIKNGSVVFCYYPDSKYFTHSRIINAFKMPGTVVRNTSASAECS